MSYVNKQDHKLTIQPKIYEKCPKIIKYKQTKKTSTRSWTFSISNETSYSCATYHWFQHSTLAKIITQKNCIQPRISP